MFSVLLKRIVALDSNLESGIIMNSLEKDVIIPIYFCSRFAECRETTVQSRNLLVDKKTAEVDDHDMKEGDTLGMTSKW